MDFVEKVEHFECRPQEAGQGVSTSKNVDQITGHLLRRCFAAKKHNSLDVTNMEIALFSKSHGFCIIRLTAVKIRFFSENWLLYNNTELSLFVQMLILHALARTIIVYLVHYAVATIMCDRLDNLSILVLKVDT